MYKSEVTWHGIEIIMSATKQTSMKKLLALSSSVIIVVDPKL
jgi:hypothetical protein